jgi:hypothetical protein
MPYGFPADYPNAAGFTSLNLAAMSTAERVRSKPHAPAKIRTGAEEIISNFALNLSF